MGLVVLRHGQDGDHGDGALAPQLAAGALVHTGQVGVQIAGVAPASGDLLLGGGDFAQRLGVVGDIRQDHQHVHILLKGQVLRGGQGHAGRGDTLHGGVVGQVGEQHRALDGAGALELPHKELRLLKGDADSGEHHGEVGAVVQHPGLSGDLGCQIGVRQAGAGENGQLLAADQRVQSIDGADAGLNELVGIVTGRRVHGQAVDVPVFLRQQGGAAVDGFAHAVEHAPQHIGGYAQLQGVAQEADGGIPQIDAGGGVEQLDHGAVAVDLQHLAAADLAAVQLDLRQLVIGDALHMVHHHQGTGHLVDGTVFLHHSSSPAFRISSAISRSISARTAA